MPEAQLFKGRRATTARRSRARRSHRVVVLGPAASTGRLAPLGQSPDAADADADVLRPPASTGRLAPLGQQSDATAAVAVVLGPAASTGRLAPLGQQSDAAEAAAVVLGLDTASRRRIPAAAQPCRAVHHRGSSLAYTRAGWSTAQRIRRNR